MCEMDLCASEASASGSEAGRQPQEFIESTTGAADPTVGNLKTGHLGDGPESLPQSYGTIGCGLEAMIPAWSGMQHVFSVGARGPTDALHVLRGGGPPSNLLITHGVDLLAVDVGHKPKPPPTHDITLPWRTLLMGAIQDPRCIVEMWPTGAAFWRNGPTAKSCAKLWESAGYATRSKVVLASEVGGAIDQRRLVTI